MYKDIAFHITAKASFVLGSFVIHYYLGKIMSPGEYGVIGTVIAIINLEYLLVNNGVRQGVATSISLMSYSDYSVIQKGIILQLVIMSMVAMVIVVFSRKLALLIGGESYRFDVLITLVILFFMGVYFVFLGVINGRKQLRIEAIILALYPLLKLSVIPMCSLFMDRILGVEVGFIIAGIGALLLSMLVVIFGGDKERTGQPISYKFLASSSMGFSVLFMAASVMMNMDLVVVKALVAEKEFAGYYTGVMGFAKISYYMMNPFFLVTLPVITRMYKNGRMCEIEKKINETFSLVFKLVAPITIIISASSSKILTAFYSTDYKRGGVTLAILAISVFFLGVHVIMSVFLSAFGKMRGVIQRSIGMLLLDFIVCVILTPAFSIEGAALANLLSTSFFSLIGYMKMKGLLQGVRLPICFWRIVIYAMQFLAVFLISRWCEDNLITLLLTEAGLYFLFILLEFLISPEERGRLVAICQRLVGR